MHGPVPQESIGRTSSKCPTKASAQDLLQECSTRPSQRAVKSALQSDGPVHL